MTISQDHGGTALGAVLRHRWPSLLGLAAALVLYVVLPPERWVGVAFLVAATCGYPLSGLVRRHLSGATTIAVQAAAVLGFTALGVAALLLTGPAGHVLLAAGWLAHAAWDLAHHRADRMVPRWYAEACAVIDVVTGLALITAGAYR
ncbi:hypothetical protein WEH80_18650 [Actinomycetes bacterium KLBMP 9759]